MVKFTASEIKACEGVGGELVITITAPLPVAAQLGNLNGKFDIEIKQHREKRSLNANALCWKIIGSMAEILHTSEKEVYLNLLELYGVKEYLVVKPAAVETIKKLFRAVEDMGTVIVNGKRGIQLKCTVGSSQYDTQQFSRLLEGAIHESREIGGFVPDEQDVGASLALWEKERPE